MQQSGDQKETRKEDVSILHDMLKKIKEHKFPKTGSKGQKQLTESYFIITIFLEYRIKVVFHFSSFIAANHFQYLNK